MSVFHNITCNICGTGIKEPGRCHYCSLRYDGQGKPFQVYCRIIRLERVNRIKPTSMHVWLMDGKVAHVSGYKPFHWGEPVELIGMSESDCLDLLIEKDFDVIDVQQPVFVPKTKSDGTA